MISQQLELTMKVYYIVLVFFTIPLLASSCGTVADDAKPKGLEERALDSDIVIAGYTRTVYRTAEKPYSYSAEFLVFNVVKGAEHVTEVYQKRKPSALETSLNRRLVNVTNFGDPCKWDSDVRPGETYILFLDILASGELGARYDGMYGPAVVYARDKETALEAIGSSPWSEWSPCSGSCGGGIQQRKRQCDGSSKCSSDEGQQRTCNMFSCAGILNVLEVAGVHRSTHRPAGRPTAFRLLQTDSWRSKEEEVIFPRTFPWEFSLLAMVRVRPSSSGGFLLRVLHSGSLQVGLYISDIITLVLSDRENIRVSFVKSLFDDHWHNIGFSVRRNTVSFYLDCEYSGKLPLPGKIRPFGGQPATVIIGSTGDHELDAFQGDIEQLTILGSPDAAEKQCNSTTKPFHDRTGYGMPRQELRSKTVGLSSMTQNDQRGDLANDDEDYSDDGSGDDYDYKDKNDGDANKKIPLKAEIADDKDEDDDDNEEEDDDNDDDEDDDNKKTKDHKTLKDQDPLNIKDLKFDFNNDISKTSEAANDYDNEVIVDSKIKPDHRENKKYEDKIDLDHDFEKNTSLKIKDDEIDNLIDQNLIIDDKNIKSNFEFDNLKLNDSSYVFPSIKVTPIVETISYNQTDTAEDDIKSDSNSDDDDEDDDIDEGSGSEPEIKTAWSEWSPCSNSCGWGRRSRTLYCLDNGMDLKSCAEATADRSEAQTCFLRLCPLSSTTVASTIPASTTTPLPWRNFTINVECQVPCKNGGRCTSPYRCTCPKGYHGSVCQYAKPTCRVNCQNGGSCFPPSKCICSKGYFGNECQYALCKPQCLNGGTCVAPNICQCKPGYIGKSCHKVVCPQGCKNGGECIAPNKCACRSGFSGKDCSQARCDPGCQNGGECVKPYVCHCPPGTRGPFCEKFLCKPDCHNGGICIGPGRCSCPRGYSGHSCEYAFCPGGCINGGKCGKTGKCVCPTGYTGARCEIRKPCKLVEVKHPYKRGYKQKVAISVQVPCGAWDWKLCTKTKVHYEMVYKTFYRTSYECEIGQTARTKKED